MGGGVLATPVKYPGVGATLAGYFCRPAAVARCRGVVLIGGSGLDGSGRAAAYQIANKGFAVLAADPLSRLGGTGSLPSPSAARRALVALTEAQKEADVRAAVQFLERHSAVRSGYIHVVTL